MMTRTTGPRRVWNDSFFFRASSMEETLLWLCAPELSGVVDDWLNDCNPIIYYEKGPDASAETKKVMRG
jgi:hypothetical protein